MPLQRVERISVVDQICDSIKKSIADGSLSEGEKLEPESHLAELFGVNRFTVRLALQKLSTLGLIETKVGEGSFVKSASIKQYVKEMWVFWDEDIREEDVARLRYLIETDSIVLASKNATEIECQELQRCLSCYNKLLSEVKKNVDNQIIIDLVEADLDFHMQIVRMSHNQLYEEVYTMIRELVKGHIQSHIDFVKLNAQNGEVPEDVMHKQAYEAIINQDPEAGKRFANRLNS